MPDKNRLFDVRLVIGGLFVIYGLIVGGLGLLDGQSEIDKAEGVRINLWMGLAMLALGLFMLIWMRLNPTGPAPSEPASSDSESSEPGKRSDQPD